MSARKKRKAKLDDSMSLCLVVLKQLHAKPDANPFLQPVDWEAYGLLDYPEIIKVPMDLGTVMDRLERGKYSEPDVFAHDVRLVWKNAMRYNRQDSDIYHTAEALSKFFDKKMGKLLKGSTRGGNAGTPAKRKKPGVSRQDRVDFSKMVTQLGREELGKLVDRIMKTCPDAIIEEDEDEVEVEINKISGTLLIELNTFMASTFKGKA